MCPGNAESNTVGQKVIAPPKYKNRDAQLQADELESAKEVGAAKPAKKNSGTYCNTPDGQETK